MKAKPVAENSSVDARGEGVVVICRVCTGPVGGTQEDEGLTESQGHVPASVPNDRHSALHSGSQAQSGDCLLCFLLSSLPMSRNGFRAEFYF